MALKIIFADAGQGDCTLIKLPDNSCILVDCGCKKNKSVIDKEIVKIFNRELPSKNLKAVVLTHPDGDHYMVTGKATWPQRIEDGWVKLAPSNGKT